MAYFLNFIHYLIYLCGVKFHFWFDKINPGNLIYKIPYVVKRLKIPVVDHKKLIDGLSTDKENGSAIINAGGVIVPLVAGMAYIPISIVKNLIGYKEFFMPAEFFVVLIVASFFPCYLTIFKKDNYLKYFEIFESLSRKKKFLYTTLLVLITASLFAIAFLTS